MDMIIVRAANARAERGKILIASAQGQFWEAAQAMAKMMLMLAMILDEMRPGCAGSNFCSIIVQAWNRVVLAKELAQIRNATNVEWRVRVVHCTRYIILKCFPSVVCQM
jgi:hypothetical protein